MTETSRCPSGSRDHFIAGFPHGNHRTLAAAQEELDRAACQEAEQNGTAKFSRGLGHAWIHGVA